MSEMVCNEIVEVVTAYLEDTCPPTTGKRSRSTSPTARSAPNTWRRRAPSLLASAIPNPSPSLPPLESRSSTHSETGDVERFQRPPATG